MFERVSSPPKSLSPKIVVLGATGKIGRRVIRQLMALESDMTIVAFVRDYDKACDVLYDELTIEHSSKGPTLQLVVMDLVPPSFVAGYKAEEEKKVTMMKNMPYPHQDFMLMMWLNMTFGLLKRMMQLI